MTGIIESFLWLLVILWTLWSIMFITVTCYLTYTGFYTAELWNEVFFGWKEES